jgi:type I restriction enzyme, S subunit
VDFDPVRAKAAGRQPEGMDAETAALFPDRFEETALGEVPRGWKSVALPDAFEINPSRRLQAGKVAPYLEMSNLPTTSLRVIAWESREFTSGMRFTNGDVLVARITPYLENGKTAFVDFLGHEEVGWDSTEYIVLRSKPPLPDIYAYLLARGGEFRTFAIQNMTGTSGRQRVPVQCFAAYMIVLPTANVAGQFGKAVSPLMNSSKQNDEQSRTLITARDALLPRLLTGEIRVREAEQQLEAVL